MSIPAQVLSYDEFRLFLMLYAANADGNISKVEQDLMMAEFDSELYGRVKEMFTKCTDMEALELILSHKSKFLAGQADVDKVLADMVRIYEVDSGFQSIEKAVHKLFQRILA
jgi:hypothetical protein